MASSSAAPLKKGLKVFVIPKNLGNPYFTVSDSVKSGGALAALKELGERDGDERLDGDRRVADPRHPGRDHEGSERTHRVCVRLVGAVSDAQVGDEEGHHRRHVRLRRTGLPHALHQPGGLCRDRQRRGRRPREADRRRGQDRDSLGGRLGDEPERVDRAHEAAAEEVSEDGARQRSSTATTIRPSRPRSRRASCSSTRTSRASSRPPRSGSPPLLPFSTRPSTGAR